jgi:hypothetical protein
MHPLDDAFYARLLTLSDAELFHYIQYYSHYKVEAVHAAIAELLTRGLHVTHDTLAEIEQYFTRQEQQRMRPFNLAPSQLRWLSYVIFTIGIGMAIVIYVTASSTPPHPLGYDPFASKKYVRELEVFGGKINILAVEFRQWFESLWRGKTLAYTIAFLTLMLSSLLWFMGSPSAAPLDTHAEKPPAPSDAWS